MIGLTNTESKLGMVICSSYYIELKKTIEELGYSDVIPILIPTNCATGFIKWEDLEHKVSEYDHNFDKILILTGFCSRGLNTPPEHLQNYQIIKEGVTANHLLEPMNFDKLISSGSYIICPNILSNWKEFLKDSKGSDNPFGSSIKKLTLIRTKYKHKLDGHLAEFSKSINMQAETIDVGMEYFVLRIKTLYLEWKLELEKKLYSKKLTNYQQQSAQFSMAFDMLRKITGEFSMDKVIQNTFILFATFFSSEAIYLKLFDYNSAEFEIHKFPAYVKNDDKFDFLYEDQIKKGYLWKAEEKMLYLVIKYANHVLGYLKICGISFSDRIRSYISTSQFISSVCGLAINNARIYLDLQNSEKKFRSIFEAIPDLFLLVRKDYKIIDYRGGDQSDFPEQGYINRNLRDLFPYDIASKFEQNVLNTLASEKPQYMEYELLMGKDSALKYFEARYLHFADDVCAIFIRDISRRKNAENTLKNFISIASHELRTPVAALSQSINLLNNHYDRIPDSKKLIIREMMAENVQLELELIEDLLALSRLEGNVGPEIWEKFNIWSVIQRILVILAPKADSKKIQIDVKIDRDLYLYGDQKKMGQILRILVDNALKYSYEDSKIEIRANDEYIGDYNPENLDGVLFEVKDDGIGVKNEDIPKMFQKFFRASNVGEIGGTGLGLNIGKHLAKLAGGDIFLQSEYKKGSTFSVFLPRSETPISTDAKKP